MSARPPHRRGSTRWLLTVPLVGLALIVVGVWALEAIAPQSDEVDLAVDDVPPVTADEVTTCRRGSDETGVEELRRSVIEGARVSSTQVYACPMAYDGLDITFVGELVGELLPRRGGVWAQVNDDAYALRTGPLVGHRQREGSNTGLSVWLPDGLHERVEDVGRAGRRGDVIEVRGILERADPDDGGGLTVRAQELEVLAPSEEVAVPFHLLQAVVAGILALAAAGALWWARRRRR